MRRLVALCIVLPWWLGAQEATRRAWFTTAGEMRATADGWVEWRIALPSPSPPHQQEFYGIAPRFTPSAAKTWATATRRAVADSTSAHAKTVIPPLTDGEAEISLTVKREAAGTRYEMFASSCRGSNNVGPSRGDVMMLADALEAAARTAASLRSSPASRGRGPFPVSEVTCPAVQRRAYMPAWSAAFGARPASRGEALAHFVVGADGRIEPSTLTFDRPPAPAAERVARAVLATWRFEAALSGRQRVSQWTHAQVWFADSADAAEWQAAGRVLRRSFIARRDGRIEHAYVNRYVDSLWLPNEAPRIHEAFDPSAVHAWFDTLMIAGRDGEMEAPGGITRRHGLYLGCSAYPTTSTGAIEGARASALADSIRSVLAEADRQHLAPVDSSRVHGETEVTCPARVRGALAPALARSPSIHEQLLSFVVGRDGRVDERFIAILGHANAGEASVIRTALLAQPWEPGRLAGVRVPQRAHLALYPASVPSADFATMACVQASAVAVRIHVREPEKGIASTELTRLAVGYSRALSRQARPSATDGTFTLVLDEDGGPHYFAWTRMPRDSAGAFAADVTFGHRYYGLGGGAAVPIALAAPTALEVTLLPACP